jgi:hypothetical protein
VSYGIAVAREAKVTPQVGVIAGDVCLHSAWNAATDLRGGERIDFLDSSGPIERSFSHH